MMQGPPEWAHKSTAAAVPGGDDDAREIQTDAWSKSYHVYAAVCGHIYIYHTGVRYFGRPISFARHRLIRCSIP